MNSEPIILLDVLSKEYANEIEQCLQAEKFPWYHIHDSYEQDISSLPLRHQFMFNGNVNSIFMGLIAPVAIEALDKSGNTVSIIDINISECDAFLQCPTISQRNEIKTDNITVIYCANDCDGDIELYDVDNILHSKITPQKNKAVLYDNSLYYHVSKPPSNKKQIIIFSTNIVR